MTDDERASLGASAVSMRTAATVAKPTAQKADTDSLLVSAADAATLADAAISAGVIDRTKRADLIGQLVNRSRAKARGLLAQLSSLKGK